MLQDTRKKMDYQAIARRCYDDVGVSSLDGFHYLIAAPAIASAIPAKNADVADLIPDQRHRSGMQSGQNQVPRASFGDWMTVIIQAFDDHIESVKVVCIQVSALRGDLNTFATTVGVCYARSKHVLDKLAVVGIEVVTPCDYRAQWTIPSLCARTPSQRVQRAGETPQML